MRGELQQSKTCVTCPHYLSPVPQKNTLMLCFQALKPPLFPGFSSMASGIKNRNKILKSTRFLILLKDLGQLLLKSNKLYEPD